MCRMCILWTVHISTLCEEQVSSDIKSCFLGIQKQLLIRETDRQTDTQANRHAGGQTRRRTDIGRLTGRQTGKKTDWEAERQVG